MSNKCPLCGGEHFAQIKATEGYFYSWFSDSLIAIKYDKDEEEIGSEAVALLGCLNCGITYLSEETREYLKKVEGI